MKVSYQYNSQLQSNYVCGIIIFHILSFKYFKWLLGCALKSREENVRCRYWRGIIAGSPTFQAFEMEHFNWVLSSKYGRDRAAWDVSAHAWNITVCDFFSFFTTPTGRHGWPIFTIYTSNDAFSRKEVPFGGLDDEFSHLPPVSPQNLKICIMAYGNFERQ